MVLAQGLPEYSDSAPPWVYVVGVAAFVIVAAITAAPSIIEKLRVPTKAEPPKPDLSAATSPLPATGAALPETDTLRSMIIDLQSRLTRSETREDELQERVVTLTGDLATAHAKITSLERQIEIMAMDRRG